MRSHGLFLAGVLLTAAALAAGCNGDDLSSPTTGTLQITTTPGGDPDGYTVQIDNAEPRAIAPGGTVEVAGLASGDHLVTLGDVATNCAVAGENPRTVRVDGGSTAVITFEVACSSLLGTLEISTTTAGESLDPDGYALSVDGTERHGPIGILVETLIVPGLPPGEHTVDLREVAPNCTVAEGSSQTVTVAAGTTVKIQFSVSCSFIGITKWRPIPLPPSVTAVTDWTGGRTLWGTSPSDLFLIGQTPEPLHGIWHYDGTGWSEHVTGTDTLLSGLWGFSSTDVYAVGVGPGDDDRYPGVILHYQGSGWAAVPGPVPDKLFVFTELIGIWGASSSDVFVSGSSLDLSDTYDPDQEVGLLGHFDGQRWSRMVTPAFGASTYLTNLAGTSGTDVWAIGTSDPCSEGCDQLTAMILHYDGRQWSESFGRIGDTYTGIWATSPNDVWAVGENQAGNAIVVHFDGSSWTRGEPLSSPIPGLLDVWGSSSSDVYAVGDQTLLHYNGNSWTKISDVGGNRVWGLSREDVFILLPYAILHGSPS
jgi:hypothetical protein